MSRSPQPDDERIHGTLADLATDRWDDVKPETIDPQGITETEPQGVSKKAQAVPATDSGGGGGGPPSAGEKLIANERLKLMANNLDRASTACFTVGVATPIAGWLYGVSGLDQLSLWYLVPIIGGWLVAAGVLNHFARRILRGLIP